MLESWGVASRRDLRNPPIGEALVDLRAVPKNPLPAALEELRNRLRDRYPKHRVVTHFEASVEIKPGAPPAAKAALDRGPHGYFFQSADGLDIAQFRVDGFTYNRLRPYTSGPAVIAEALRLWSVFAEVLAPSMVSRVALRYLNQMTLPRVPEGYGQFLTRPPAVPVGASGRLVSFIDRVESYDEKTGVRAICTQASEEVPAESNSTVVLLDLDVFLLAETGILAKELEATLHALRGLKNNLFFGAITETTVGLFE